ncbi:UDP-glycosyltransferase 73E1-like [Gossypium hirsutum]|uniref:UDP-glycosyltransferase 73E1-like n=1 Tax=Gossypium hirsutum TaxID=3635 RepID=A0A1U8MES3_GOSHI|nr:UDP-glycosyltransferase 73E1-like [Gossypium hirsutum]
MHLRAESSSTRAQNPNDSMSSQSSKLHFVFIPLMCPGHLIPMVDMGRLLAQHGVTVTIVTTPLNASRIKTIIDRDIASGIQLQLLQLRFPCIEAGLPEGCENIDALPSRPCQRILWLLLGCYRSHLSSSWKRHNPNQAVFYQIDITPGYLIYEKVSDDLEPFVVPGLPDRIELTRGQLPNDLNPVSVVLKVKEEDMRIADMASYGLVVNSSEELKPRFGYWSLATL